MSNVLDDEKQQQILALGRGRNAVVIWQGLVDDHGFTARYASVRRFVLKLRGATPDEARSSSRPR